MSMSPRESGTLLALLLCAAVALPAVATAAAPPGAVATQQTTPEREPVAENTTFYLRLQADGDARWTITDTYALEDRNDTEAFESLAEEFVNGDADTGWLTAFRKASGAASTATGREMAITDVNRDYVVTDRRGTLILEFTWTNFATVQGENLVVGDAFNTTDGTWLQSLTSEQRLVISPPPGYGFESAPGAVVDRKFSVEGPRTFEPGYLTIVYTGDQSVTPTPTETPESQLVGETSIWLGGVLLVVLVLGSVGYAVRRGHKTPSPSGSGSAGESSPDGGGATTAESAGTDTSEEEVDVELLSDEERVERLLERNGGRMKQARIVSETGWSNAKVSQLLSSMDEDDRIDKLRIGRENLISFPDEDITDFDE